MGAELLTIADMGVGLASGIAGYGSKTAQGSMYESEGIRLEGEAFREASRIQDEGRRFADQQKMMYIGSGVEVGGSAVVTLEQTDSWVRAEAESVRERGRALRAYNTRTGRLRREQGVADFISGIGSGIGSGYNTYSTAKAGFGGGGYSSRNPYGAIYGGEDMRG